MKKLLILAVCFLLINSYTRAQTSVYPVADPNKVSDLYSVSVGGASSPTYKISSGDCPSNKCGSMPNKTESFTDFSSSAAVAVTVTKLGSAAAKCRILPGNKILPTSQSGGNASVTYTIPTKGVYSFEFSDDTIRYDNAMLIFAKALENDAPDTTASTTFMATDSASLRNIPDGKTTVYFRPGAYKIGQWTIPDAINKVYLAGGSYVDGYLYQLNTNTTIYGRGILSADAYPFHYGGNSFGTWYRMINFASGTNRINGIILADPSAPTIIEKGTNFSAYDIDIIANFFNNDGITLYAQPGVGGGRSNLISNCFFMNQDDNIVPYINHLTVDSCTFWQKQGSMIQLGWTAHSMNDHTYTNCEVFHDQNALVNNNKGFVNAMNFGSTNSPSTLENFTISNIYYDTPTISVIDMRNDRPRQAAKPQAAFKYVNFNISNIHLAQSSFTTPPFVVHAGDNINMSDIHLSRIYQNGREIDPQLSKAEFFSKKNLN